jgi:hypothetical protein
MITESKDSILTFAAEIVKKEDAKGKALAAHDKFLALGTLLRFMFKEEYDQATFADLCYPEKAKYANEYAAQMKAAKLSK